MENVGLLRYVGLNRYGAVTVCTDLSRGLLCFLTMRMEIKYCRGARICHGLGYCQSDARAGPGYNDHVIPKRYFHA